MVKIGDVVMKIAGRDAGRVGIVTEDLGKGFFMVDGDTRKKKVNVKHIEFLGKEGRVGKGSTREELRKEINNLGFKVNKHGQPRVKKELHQKPAILPKAKTVEKPKKEAKKKESK